MSIRRRFLKITIIFFKIFRDFRKEFLLIKKGGYKYSQAKMRPIHEKRARELYNTAIEMGGVMIKLCQFFSSRRDIFPEPYIKTLSRLQDDVPPVDFKKIETVLKSEYGDYNTYFKKIDQTPIASASLGQVHRAVLKTGETVAVKILKPGIERKIDLDFAILFYTLRLLSNFKLFKKRDDFFTILNEFVRVTGNELNFKREIYIAKEFERHFKKFNYVKIPGFYDDLCTRKVIVMEYLTGDKIDNIDAWVKRNNNPKIITDRLIELYIEQLLTIKLVHYDPHPGNILVTDNNNLVMLDFGMSGRITDEMRDGMFKGLQAFVNKDCRGFIDMLDEQGFIRRDVNRYSLMPVVAFFFDEVLEVMKLNRESIQTIDLKPVFNDLVEIIYTQPFNIPFNWAYVGKTIGGLAGVISSLEPEFKIYDGIKPYAEKIFKDNFSGMFNQTIKEARTNLGTLLRLPAKASDFIENMENGYYKIHVDYSEIHDKIDEVKEFIIKLISFIIFSVSGVGSYIFYTLQRLDLAYIFGTASLMSLAVSMFYKNKNPKNKMIKYF